MIIEQYKCDKCGRIMPEYWTCVKTHADLYWGNSASVHLCCDCAKKFIRWLRE